MSKKEYLDLMRKYQGIIDDKKFNPNFYNVKKLEELKKAICRQLYIYETRQLYINELRCDFAPLIQSIKNEESIECYEYEELYKEIYIGPLKQKHFLAFILISTLIIVVIKYVGYLN